MIGGLLRKSDFERLLAVPACCRSAHFAAHHVRGGPSAPLPGPRKQDVNELSTALSTDERAAVDDLPDLPSALWLGCVIPKRHAVRSVTRNMLRRQIRAAVQRHQPRLQSGLWLVRLRRPFARSDFRSAASTALSACAAGELDRLFGQAAA
ncbi:MAG: ribonuclease P protein component [Rubrivivax sp.]